MYNTYSKHPASYSSIVYMVIYLQMLGLCSRKKEACTLHSTFLETRKIDGLGQRHQETKLYVVASCICGSQLGSCLTSPLWHLLFQVAPTFFLNFRTLGLQVLSTVTENDFLTTDICIFHVNKETDTEINVDETEIH